MRESFKKGLGLTLGIGAGILTIKILRGLFHIVIGRDEDDILDDSDEVIEIEL